MPAHDAHRSPDSDAGSRPDLKRVDRRARRQQGAIGRNWLAFASLLMTLFAVILFLQYAQIAGTRRALQSAAETGARAAVQPGADRQRVNAVVRRSLANWKFGPHIDPIVIWINEIRVGDLSLRKATLGDRVAVTVSVDADRAVWGVLRIVGKSLFDEKLEATVTVVKE